MHICNVGRIVARTRAVQLDVRHTVLDWLVAAPPYFTLVREMKTLTTIACVVSLILAGTPSNGCAGISRRDLTASSIPPTLLTNRPVRPYNNSLCDQGKSRGSVGCCLVQT
jgi:hypothetical protein